MPCTILLILFKLGRYYLQEYFFRRNMSNGSIVCLFLTCFCKCKMGVVYHIIVPLCFNQNVVIYNGIFENR